MKYKKQEKTNLRAYALFRFFFYEVVNENCQSSVAGSRAVKRNVPLISRGLPKRSISPDSTFGPLP
jgi:hypothetical protein